MRMRRTGEVERVYAPPRLIASGSPCVELTRKKRARPAGSVPLGLRSCLTVRWRKKAIDQYDRKQNAMQ